MILTIYPYPLIASILLLVIWTYFNKQKLWNTFWSFSFLMSLGLYLVIAFFGNGTLEDKFSLVFRDMIILGSVGIVFQFLARNTGTFLVGFFFLVGGLIWVSESDLFKPKAAVELSTTELASDGEWLVEIAPHYTQTDLNKLLSDYNVQITRAFYPKDADHTELDDYYLVDVLNNKKATIQKIQSLLMQADFVDWIEGNETIKLDPNPTVPVMETTQRESLIDDPEVSQLWGFDVMQVAKLHSLLKDNNLKPKKTAVIAILDTGVDGKHEDLKGNYKTTQKKYDRDVQMHGTHCAGIAGAVSNNGIGIASFSPSAGLVKITSIKVLSDFGAGTQQMVIKGIIEAADKGADVISLSLGARSTQARQTAYKKAVQYANDKGVIVVAAAGNSSMDAKDYSPVNTAGVIGVSAIDPFLEKASFSNYVSNIEMGVAAPGVNIYSTTPNNNYKSLNGTSMATPYVSGLVGLMKSFRPDLDTQTAYEILNRTGKNTNTTTTTGRLIQPHLAIQELLNAY